jgi:sugar phosphate isomerase/epimerase
VRVRLREPPPPDPTRRRLLGALPAAVVGAAWPWGQAFPAGQGKLGIAYTSFAIRMRQGRDLIRGARPGAPSFPAETFVDLCRSFGADGCQMDVTQLASTEAAYLDGVKRRIADAGLFLELSVDAAALEDQGRFDDVAALARRLGAARLRVALLHGRRYEDFPRKEQWLEFAGHWQQTLPRAKAWLERHRIPVGIENHKDFLADELADLLRSVGSPWLGACIDFGNNLALLEEPLEVVEKLAPFAVTTHLKDMAVRPKERGFELSEVPLGTGLLPLARMVEVLRRHRPEVPLCLEMITRDPLNVPYLDDAYWVTYARRDEGRIERFRAAVLAKSWSVPLPRVSGLALEEMVTAEDENLRRCAAFARAHLGA